MYMKLPTTIKFKSVIISLMNWDSAILTTPGMVNSMCLLYMYIHVYVYTCMCTYMYVHVYARYTCMFVCTRDKERSKRAKKDCSGC